MSQIRGKLLAETDSFCEKILVRCTSRHGDGLTFASVILLSVFHSLRIKNIKKDTLFFKYKKLKERYDVRDD